ncbi:MAG: protein kinase [Myxococcales bacterium]|nr:protein kinase [Myxococcales bacterium]
MVFAAFDPQLDRKVAIKLVRPAYTESSGDEAQARLLREAQALARLRHPNIVTVYEVGAFGDEVFVAMEFVDGVTLRTWQFEHARSWREILRVYQAAGRGLAAAHRAGLVHRDFKPDNVLVTPGGEPRVLDFGLAFRDERPSPIDVVSSDVLSAQLTMTGALVGTPAYMSPEQHRGEIADVRSDVFAFAVSLYEALYSVRPFSGATVPEICAAIFAGQITPPPPFIKIPGWLRRAVLRGLRIRPEERYSDMEVLLRALGRDPARYLAVAGVVAVFSLIIGGLVMALKTAEGRQGLRDQGAQARADFDQARAEALSADLARARASDPQRRFNEWVLAAAQARLETSPEAALATLKHLSPRGGGWTSARAIAAEAVARGIPRRVWRSAAPIDALAFVDDERWLISGDGSGHAQVVDVASGEIAASIDLAGPITAIAGAAPPRAAATTEGAPPLRVALLVDDSLVLWDVASGALRELPDADLLALAIAPDGAEVATGGRDHRLRIRSWEGAELHTYPTHDAPVSALAYASDGRYLASGGADGRVILWKLADDTRSFLGRGKAGIRALTFDADGGRLHAIDRSEVATSWVLSGTPTSSTKDAIASLRSAPGVRLQLDPAGVATVSHEAPSARRLSARAARAIDLSASGRLAAIATDAGLELWETRSRPARSLPPSPVRLERLAASRGGRWLAGSSREGGLFLWELESGARQALRPAGPEIRAFFFGERGDHLVLVDSRPSLSAWSLDGDEPRPLALAEARPSLFASAMSGAHPLRDGGILYWQGERLELFDAAGGRRWDADVGELFEHGRLVAGGDAIFISGRRRVGALLRREPGRATQILELGDASHRFEAIADVDGAIRVAAARLRESTLEGLVVWEIPWRSDAAEAPTPHVLHQRGGVRKVIADGAREGVVIINSDLSQDLWHLGSGSIVRLPRCLGDVDALTIDPAERRAVLVHDALACVVDLDEAVTHVVPLSGDPWAWDRGDALASVHGGDTIDLWIDPVPRDPADLRAWLDDATDLRLTLDELPGPG